MNKLLKIIDEILNNLRKIKIRLQDLGKYKTYENYKKIHLINYDNDETLERDYNSSFKSIDLKALNENIINLEKRIEKYKEYVKYEYDNLLNDNYKEYLQNLLVYYKEKTDPNLYETNIYPTSFSYNWHDLFEIVKSITTEEDVVDIFRYKNDNKNYIVFGKNGAGKSRLLKYVSENFTNNVFYIPSSKNVEFNATNMIYTLDLEEEFKNLFLQTSYPPNNYLLQRVDRIDHKDLTEKNKNNIINKIKKIYNSLNLDRKIEFDVQNEKIFLYNDNENIEKYNVAEASDGERTILQFIMFCLSVPKKSFIFIDEPETHLNSALLNDLFDKIEEEKSDSIFIYCTHNIEFIEKRNANLLLLKNFNGTKWDYDKVENFDAIPIDVIVNIIGTRKKVLFIEGEKNSIDYKVYSSLFPNYKIMYVGSCETVKTYCKAINDNSFLNRKAKGIVDNDIRSTKEIAKLKKKGIQVLKYNEIENFLISPKIIKKMGKKGIIDKGKIPDFENKIIEETKINKNIIVLDGINKICPKTMQYKKIVYKKLPKNVDKIVTKVSKNYENNIKKIKSKIERYIKNLEKDIRNNNVDNILKKYSNKGYLNLLERTFAIKEDEYINKVCMEMKNNGTFRKEIIDNYFEIIK